MRCRLAGPSYRAAPPRATCGDPRRQRSWPRSWPALVARDRLFRALRQVILVGGEPDLDGVAPGARQYDALGTRNLDAVGLECGEQALAKVAARGPLVRGPHGAQDLERDPVFR